VSVPYKNEAKTFHVPCQSLWDWATDLVSHPQLADHFCWDAERIYKIDSQSSTHVFHEPWTADAFWDAQACVHLTDYLTSKNLYMPHDQSQIPEGGNLLCFILYADKTKLSSFGSTKGYPVVAHCANLPAAIRNGNGFGGGCVVRWLPIVMLQIPYLLFW
jgi:Plavaka transposase